MYFYGGGWHSYTVYGCTLAPLGEYYFPPKLLTAAELRSYVKLLWPLVIIIIII